MQGESGEKGTSHVGPAGARDFITGAMGRRWRIVNR